MGISDKDCAEQDSTKFRKLRLYVEIFRIFRNNFAWKHELCLSEFILFPSYKYFPTVLVPCPF